jgi:hypothetical protein
MRAALVAAGPLLLVAGCATPPPPAPAAPPPEPTAVSTTAEVVGRVQSVDRRRREVVVITPDDRPLTLKVGPEVRNFDRIRRNDNVRVRFEEAVAVRMAEPGTSLPPEAGLAAARAAPGQRPAGAVVETVRARVRIESVDAANGRVAFTGPNGVLRMARVRTPELREFLRRLYPGDQVDVAFAEALAISVEPAER